MFLIALIVGVVMLVGGAELLVRGGGALALALRVPALVVGLTVVAFGTSTPELAVSVTAASKASTDMALANVNGSNIANIALVLGLAAMVFPLDVDRSLIRREVPVGLGLQLLVPLLCLDGVLGRGDGLALLLLGLIYNGWIVFDSWRRRLSVDDLEDVEDLDGSGGWPQQVGLLVAGLVVLLVGAQLFVFGAVQVAEWLGFSDRFIGLTVVALGTSAPEVATGVVSAYRQQSDLAVGNSLGSNILNIAMVLGITSMVRPIGITDSAVWLDLAAAVGATALLIPMVLRDRQIGRLEGGVLAGAYVTYLLVIPG